MPPLKRPGHYLLVWLARALTLCSVCYESWSEIRAEDRDLKIDRIRENFPLAVDLRDLSDFFVIWHFTRLLYSLLLSLKPHSRFENRVLTTLLLADFCLYSDHCADRVLHQLFTLLVLQLEHYATTRHQRMLKKHRRQTLNPEEPRGRSLTRKADLVYMNSNRRRKTEQLDASVDGERR